MKKPIFKNNLLLAAIVLIALAASMIFLISIAGPKPRPNIILMSIDTLRADHLQCYGYPFPTSPNIDEYSKDFVVFENAISQSPVTASAHMSLFTGLTPIVHGVTNLGREPNQNNRLDDSVPTFADILKNEGYYTVGFHEGGNVSGVLGFDKGFDLYSTEHINWKNMEETNVLADIRKWINKSKADSKPLHLFLHHYICHDPYLSAPEKFRLHFLKDPVAEIPVENTVINKEFLYVRDAFWKNVDMHKESHKRHVLALYDGAVYYSDYIFGKVMDLLKEEDFYDNSVVILLSDHGEEFFEHGDTLHWRLFIETLHVPFMIKFPGAEYGGTRVKQKIRTFDLMPSLLQYLGIKSDNVMQSSTFLPLLTGRGEYAPLIKSFSGDLRYLRFVENEYIYSNQPSQGSSEWLFNQRNDPEELENLADVDESTLTHMKFESRKLMRKEVTIKNKLDLWKQSPAKVNSKLMEQLKALGYIK